MGWGEQFKPQPVRSEPIRANGPAPIPACGVDHNLFLESAQMSYRGGLIAIDSIGMRRVIDDAGRAEEALAMLVDYCRDMGYFVPLSIRNDARVALGREQV